MQRLFNAIDKDDDGQVTFLELQDMMIRANVFGNAVYKVEISLPEFMCAVATLATCVTTGDFAVTTLHRLGVLDEDGGDSEDQEQVHEEQRVEEEANVATMQKEGGGLQKEQEVMHKTTMQLVGLMRQLEPIYKDIFAEELVTEERVRHAEQRKKKVSIVDEKLAIFRAQMQLLLDYVYSLYVRLIAPAAGPRAKRPVPITLGHAQDRMSYREQEELVSVLSVGKKKRAEEAAREKEREVWEAYEGM